MEWSRESDVALWTLDKIDRIKATSRKVQKRLNYTKFVLKSSGAMVTRAYQSLKKISSRLNESLYDIHTKMCLKLIHSKSIFKWTHDVASKFHFNACAVEIDLPTISLGKRTNKKIHQKN